jgi:hypothetical protein
MTNLHDVRTPAMGAAIVGCLLRVKHERIHEADRNYRCSKRIPRCRLGRVQHGGAGTPPHGIGEMSKLEIAGTIIRVDEIFFSLKYQGSFFDCWLSRISIQFVKCHM